MAEFANPSIFDVNCLAFIEKPDARPLQEYKYVGDALPATKQCRVQENG